MEHLSYSTAGQTGPTAVYAAPYVTTPPQSLPPSVSGGGPPPHHPPSAHSATVAGMLPYGVEIPNRVFVGGCPFSMTDKELGEVFERYGTVKDSKIISDRSTGKSKGYGFVTFSSEEEAANVHAMGSIFYNEKKLNLARAIRKCGGQFNRANQEYVNGQRAVWMHPSGYLIQQFEGNWHFEQFSPHTQPVKPCYPAPVYYSPPPTIHHHHQPYYVNSGGYSPVGSGTTLFHHPHPYTGVTATPPTTHDNSEQVSDNKRGEKEENVPSKSSPSSLLIVGKKEEPSDELVEKVQQLSLDSAYTSEADLEHSTAPSSPQEGEGDLEECSVDDEKVSEEPLDISRIVEIRRSPHSLRRFHTIPAHTGSNVPKYTSVVSSPPRLYTNGHYFNPTAAAFTPGHYVMPMTYGSPYTPHSAIQTIGPVYQ